MLGDPTLNEILSEPLSSLAERSRSQPFDAIVIGGGTAGITAAVTLVEEGSSVALLEAGPIALLTHVDGTDLRFQPEVAQAVRAPLQYEPTHQPSGEDFGMLIGCLGGRGLFWNGAAPRMQAHELADWPLELEDLEPFYDWAEQRLRVSRDYAHSDWAARLFEQLGRAGYQFESLPWAVDTHPTVNGWLGGSIGNAVSMLLRETVLVGENRNPRLAVNALATRILCEDSGEARGVRAGDRGDPAAPAVDIASRSVVLAAGAFESVRLAQVSELADPSGRLGRHLLDHVYVRYYGQLPDDSYPTAQLEVAMGLWPSTPERPFQVELHAPMGMLFGARESLRWEPGANPAYQLRLRAFGPVLGGAESRVEPGQGDEPGSYAVHLEHGREAKELAVQAEEAIRAIAGTLGASEVQARTFPPGGSFHEAGGLGMGNSEAESVINGHGRFWSAPNVCVCDAATWPGIGAANPHLTIAAVARRNAAELAKEL